MSSGASNGKGRMDIDIRNESWLVLCVVHGLVRVRLPNSVLAEALISNGQTF